MYLRMYMCVVAAPVSLPTSATTTAAARVAAAAATAFAATSITSTTMIPTPPGLWVVIIPAESASKLSPGSKPTRLLDACSRELLEDTSSKPQFLGSDAQVLLGMFCF